MVKQLYSLESAKKHPLYGNKGWALALGIFLFLNLGQGLGEFAKISNLEKSIDGLEDIKIVMAIHLILFALYIILYFKKNQHFRATFTFMQIVFIPLILSFTQEISGLSLLSEELRLEVLATVVANFVVILYLWRSKRILVTFFHQVSDDDPILKNTVTQTTKSDDITDNKKKIKTPWGSSPSEGKVINDSKDQRLSSSTKERLEELKTIEDKGLISKEEAKKKRNQILKDL